MTESIGTATGPRRVLISGAGSGIGLEIARAFVRSGDAVRVCDANQEVVAALARTDPRIGATVADVSDAAAARAWVDDAVQQLGGLDVLIDNAGIGGPTKPIEEIEDAEWHRVLDVNLSGAFYVTRAAVPYLRRSAHASIIVMSSVAGRYGYPNRLPYAATKWALVGLAKTLAIELGSDGIRVNAVQPGAVDGDRLRSILEQRAGVSGSTLEREYAAVIRNQSLPRLTQAQDVAAVCLFLASTGATVISGQVIGVDGDSQTA